MTSLVDYVLQHSDRGPCMCGRCCDAPLEPHAPGNQPAGDVAHLVMLNVAARRSPDPVTLSELVRRHKGEFCQCDLFDGKEHSYLEVGGWIDLPARRRLDQRRVRRGRVAEPAAGGRAGRPARRHAAEVGELPHGEWRQPAGHRVQAGRGPAGQLRGAPLQPEVRTVDGRAHLAHACESRVAHEPERGAARGSIICRAKRPRR